MTELGELVSWLSWVSWEFSLPAPTRMMSNDQYKKAIKIAIKEESRNQLREKLFESSKLIYLAGWDQAMGPQMMMTDLQRIQSFTRFRFNCQCIFSSDFGSGYR